MKKRSSSKCALSHLCHGKGALSTSQSVFLVGDSLLELVRHAFEMLADLLCVRAEHLLQLVYLALQSGTQFLDGHLQLGLEVLGLGLQLLAQVSCLAAQHDGEVGQLLVGDLTGLSDVWVELGLHAVQILGGARLDFTHVGGDGAKDQGHF